MPNVLLPVPIFKQSRDGYCLPVCVRMVLAYQGQERSEQELITHLGAQNFGVPISNITRLQKLGVQVDFRSFSEKELKQKLLDGVPLIAWVWTGMLTYWTEGVSHVVVVVGYDEKNVYLNDPAVAAAPQTVLWDSFLAAWAEYDEVGIVIQV